jgi:hypothetical protein
VYKGKVIMIIAGALQLLLLLQERGRLVNAQSKFTLTKANPGNVKHFFVGAEVFRLERNIYLVTFGLVALLGLFLVAWQSHSLAARNLAIRENRAGPGRQ